jgi:preprotein translocase subunit SecE
MAMIGRKQPATPAVTTSSTRADRLRGPSSGRGAGSSGGRATTIGRLRGTIEDIVAELRKVTWPTPEETRKLTIVVIGISVVLGALLGGLDMVLSYIYRLIAP